MKKTTHKSKTEINPNNGVNMEDLLKQVQNGTNEILKLQTEKVIYGEKIKTSLIVFTNSIKLIIHNASYEDEEVVQIDAFCKSTIVDMKNCNNQAPWNFQPDNFDRKKITFITDWCKISRIFGLSSLVTNISNTLTKEEEAIPYFHQEISAYL